MDFDRYLKKIKNLRPKEVIYMCRHFHNVNLMEEENVYTPSNENNEYQKIADFINSNSEVKENVYKADIFLHSKYEFLLISDLESITPYHIEHYVITDKSNCTVDQILICISKKAIMEQLSKFAQVKTLFSDIYPVNDQEWIKTGIL